MYTHKYVCMCVHIYIYIYTCARLPIRAAGIREFGAPTRAEYTQCSPRISLQSLVRRQFLHMFT